MTFGWLDRLIAHARRDPTVGIVGPLSNTASWQSVPNVFEGENWARNPLPAGADLDTMRDVVARSSAQQGIPLPFLNGFCLLLRRPLIEQIGLFDEDVFGAGYGEENDYCIRARSAKWRLLVADDCYVFHAESLSYSHERRRELSKAADQKLVEKHDPKIHIWPHVEACKSGLAITAVRSRVTAGLRRHEIIQSARERYEGKRIAFVLPCASEGGGANVIMQEARALRRFGVDSWLINLAPYRTGFEIAYPNHGLPVIYASNEHEVEFIVGDPDLDFDAAVATLYRSVSLLPARDRVSALGYYVQDFEPEFFAADDPEREVALRSYVERPDVRLFCKTPWNANAVRAATHRDIAVIGPSVDIDLFRPGPDQQDPGDARPLRICALVRPSTPRRGATATIRLLDQLQSTLGAAVDITIFGSNHRELAEAGLDRPTMRNLGPLRHAQVAFVLEGSDIFIDCSIFQAMGLTAIEPMASGCAVLVPVMQHLNSSIVVWQNAVDERLMLPVSKRPASGMVRLGYFGTPSHTRDFLAVRGQLNEFFERVPYASFEWCGLGDGAQLARWFPSIARTASRPPIGDYVAFFLGMQSELDWDIGIAPLADIPFNRYKSDIKFLEYASFGIAGIYADLTPYASVVHGVTGLRVQPDRWRDAISELAEDLALRLKIVENARDYVLESKTLEKGVRNLWNILQSIG